MLKTRLKKHKHLVQGLDIISQMLPYFTKSPFNKHPGTINQLLNENQQQIKSNPNPNKAVWLVTE